MNKEITTKLVRELLDYDQDTGVFTWKARGRLWFTNNQAFNRWNNRYAGEVSGNVMRKGVKGYPSVRIKVREKLWLAHRLAFIWMGEDLPKQVDHRNRDSLDNRWKNLCSSSQEENTKNKSKMNNNTSGVTGVCWHKGAGRWRARVSVNGNRKNLGYFADLEQAAEAVKKFRAANGFSVGHGEELANYVDRTGLCL